MPAEGEGEARSGSLLPAWNRSCPDMRVVVRFESAAKKGTQDHNYRPVYDSVDRRAPCNILHLVPEAVQATALPFRKEFTHASAYLSVLFL